MFIGKPCDTDALHKLRLQRPELDRNLGLVLSFFCAGTPSTQGTLDLLEQLETNREEVEGVRYRGEGWPGSFKATPRNGSSEKSLSYEEAWGRLTKYVPLRCRLCPDGLGRVADIACGDAWHRYQGNSEEGTSLVLVRTERGKRDTPPRDRCRLRKTRTCRCGSSSQGSAQSLGKKDGALRQAVGITPATGSGAEVSGILVAKKLDADSRWAKVPFGNGNSAAGRSAKPLEAGLRSEPGSQVRFPDGRKMDPTTLIVAAVGSVLAIALSPIRALCAYLCVLLLHSQDLGVSLGVIDFSSARIVVFALTANVLLRAPHLVKAFRWNLLDTFVVLYFIGQLISLFNTEPFMVVLENRSGRLTDTVLPYFLCRAILRSKRDLIMVIKTLILVSLPLAFFGVVESARGWNYLQGLPAAYRDGHFRARGTFSVTISFGLFFAAVVPLCIGLWHQRVWSKGFLVFCVCCCMAGLISSWSSGPILAMYFAIMFLCCYPIRRMWPLLLVAGFAMIVLVDNLSNRRWYEVPTRFLLSSSTAYYRIGLYKEAFGGGMTDHWLFGWGLVANVYSTYEEFPWEHRDMTSMYIKHLASYGLVGAIPSLCVLDFLLSSTAAGFFPLHLPTGSLACMVFCRITSWVG